MSILGIAIVNYLSAGDTDALVRSIVARNRGSGLSVALAIVDNSDQPALLEPVVEFAKADGIAATLIHGHGNVGYAAGNNLAAGWLLRFGVDAIWVLNPDTRITGGSLGAVRNLLRTGDRAIGATTSATPGGAVRAGLGMLDLWTGQSGQVPADGSGRAGKLIYPAGHSLLVTRRAWTELNGFSEDFFLFFEEADLTLRSARLGIPTTVIADLTVDHVGGGATGATRNMRSKSITTYFHASRSCMIFFRRHYRGRLPVAVAARLGYAGKALLRSGPRAAGAVVRGTVSGLRG
jgi:GT2 family glycosyltransferase